MTTLEDDADPRMLYRPVPQIEDPSVMKPVWKLISPERARQMLLKADTDPNFRQRPISERDVRRWRLLMETNRFVNFLPIPICEDDQGVLINGKHRLMALSRQSQAHGFLFIRNVPRWMASFFDSGRPLSLSDVFYRLNRMTKAQTGSTMRLAMRYEETLHGLRPASGWRKWAGERDEHFDVDDFLMRREPLGDLYVSAEHTYRPTKLILASLMVFRFYQELAWPEGADQVADFFDGLRTGAMPPKSPALVLRAWGRDTFDDERIPGSQKIQAKRELHLVLLFRMFELHVKGDRPHKLNWAYGFPMPMPYHPNGDEAAVGNVLAALTELDRAADKERLAAGTTPAP